MLVCTTYICHIYRKKREGTAESKGGKRLKADPQLG